MRQIPLPIGPLAEPTFSNFLPGPNAAALVQLLSAANALPASQPAPIYIWGAAGSGKTHLLQALASHMQGRDLQAAGFQAHTPQPWHWSPDWQLVTVDGCDALDSAAQQATFALFIEAATQGTQLVLAGRLPPVDLPLRDDLKSRLAWGHILALQPLDDADTRAALQKEAQHRGLLLPDEVLDYLLNRVERNLGYLMRLLDELDAYALAEGRHITVPLARTLLAQTDLASV